MNLDNLDKYLFVGRFSCSNISERENKYLYNIELSKSFYFLLQNLELTLRNVINNELCLLNNNWLNDNNLLELREINKINKVQKNIRNNEKLFSKLDFGFYCRLFDSKYEKKIWHKIIKKSFPNLDKKNRNRKFLSERLIKFKSLRNKIAHHEPIYFWDDLENYKDGIIEFIGWINSDVMNFTLKNDKIKNILK